MAGLPVRAGIGILHLVHSSTRTRVSFDSEGAACAGHVYLPGDARAAVPCVVMANGFSGTMDWILPWFAERFAAAGLAVLIFDYRHLGASEGQPRQLIDVRKQRADLQRAVALARTYQGIDPERIALWGTSLGGSHVVDLAARDARIAAVICNMPALDALRGGNVAAKMRRAQVSRSQMAGATARLLAAAAIDAVRGLIGLSPRYIAVYGRPGEAFFTDPSLAERFRTVEENSPTWENRVAPRFLFGAPRYREGTMERIRVPLLISLASKDVEVSSAFVKEKARKAPRAEIKEYPADHFEMYHGATFEQVVADQIDFLRKHLLDDAA
jgi:dienelactone hydrolase